MNWFYNLKTAQKLALGFGLCLTLAVLVGIVAILRMARVYQISRSIITDTVDSLQILERIDADARGYRTAEYRQVVNSSPAEMQAIETEITTYQTDADKAIQDYGAMSTDPTDKANFDQLQSAWQGYVAMTPPRSFSAARMKTSRVRA